jgi:hypothetical protein
MLAAGVALLIAQPAGATPLKIEAEDAADHHIAAQGTYANGLAGSWEYQFGSGRSAPNITGIAAHGLLAAYKLSGEQAHRQSAERAAKGLIAAYDRGWSGRRPYTQDVEFLAAVGFIIDAGRWFKVTTARYTPDAYVDYVLTGRQKQKRAALAGWDVASAIRAALAVGQVDYARGLLKALLTRRHAWDRPGALGQDLARGSLVWALGEMRVRAGLTPEQQRLGRTLVRDLVTRQQHTGGWLEAPGGVFCTQTTAYAILGLSRWSDGKAAAERGRQWLVGAAVTDKKFFYGGRIWATTYTKDGRPEPNFTSAIQSEAMMALATGAGQS